MLGTFPCPHNQFKETHERQAEQVKRIFKNIHCFYSSILSEGIGKFLRKLIDSRHKLE